MVNEFLYEGGLNVLKISNGTLQKTSLEVSLRILTKTIEIKRERLTFKASRTD